MVDLLDCGWFREATSRYTTTRASPRLTNKLSILLEKASWPGSGLSRNLAIRD